MNNLRSIKKTRTKSIFAALVFVMLVLIPITGTAQTDLLQILTDYADEMIKNGRDDARYGQDTSPLFAVMLRRDTDSAVMFPYPQIPTLENKTGDIEPGHRWLYYTGTNFINIPGLQTEKLHKYTVSGEDVMEHYGLYRMLYDLSELTEDSTYANAADEALIWWYKNTQGPSGLFPWGEHLGWDFRYDFVTYHVQGHHDFYNNPYHDFDGTPIAQWISDFQPITQLYQAFQHEPRIPDLSGNILLENLKNLPLQDGETYTPLEKYAFGCWREHIIDLEKGGFNRHGDYFGRRWGVEGRWGGDGNYPRIIGQFFDYWSYTWMHTGNSVVKDSLEIIMETMVDYLAGEKDNNGLYHHYYNQIWKAASGAELAAERLYNDNPTLSQKLKQFSDSQITAMYSIWPEGKNLSRMMTLWFITEREDLKPYLKQAADIIYNTNSSTETTASGFANSIRQMVNAYLVFEEEKYLKKAGEFCLYAVRTMFDDYSPLPRINTADSLYSGNGEAHANYYHAHAGSDDLMWALALYAGNAGWIIENKKPIAEAGNNLMVKAGDMVQLDGSGSNDPEGGPLSYVWKTTSEIILDDSTLMDPTFTAPGVDTITTYEIGLIVNDGMLDSDPDKVYIIINPALSTDQSFSREAELYPNPFSENLNIRLPEGIDEPLKLIIIDLSGKVFDNLLLDPVDRGLDLSYLPSGMYVMQLKRGKYIILDRIMYKE